MKILHTADWHIGQFKGPVVDGVNLRSQDILGTLSGSNNKLLLCGNPTRTSGTFYDSHTRDRALYKCHTVSSADSSRTRKG